VSVIGLAALAGAARHDRAVDAGTGTTAAAATSGTSIGGRTAPARTTPAGAAPSGTDARGLGHPAGATTTTANPTPSTTVGGVADGWRDAERQQVIDARQALWRQGRGAPAPHERLDVASVALDEVDGAPVALLHTCTVQQQGDTFDIFGGLVSAGGGYESDLTVEVMGRVGGHWKVATHLVAQSRTRKGEAGCATD
jgi:hypothetical protein